MHNLSAADRQISASTIGQYRAMATPYRDGTWNHDVSQNIQALLAAIAGASPYHPRSRLRARARSRDLPRPRPRGRRARRLPRVRGHGARGVRVRSLAAGHAGHELAARELRWRVRQRCPVPRSEPSVARRPRPPARSVEARRRAARLQPAWADEEGFVHGRYACFYSLKTWRRLVSSSGFGLVDHISARPASPAASSRGSPQPGASRHRQISSALAEGATRGANLVRRLRRFAP